MEKKIEEIAKKLLEVVYNEKLNSKTFEPEFKKVLTDALTPSLPTDEEIKQKAWEYGENIHAGDKFFADRDFFQGAKWLRTNFSSEKCGFTIDDMKKACAVGIDIANKEGENDFKPFEDLINSLSPETRTTNH